jgi:parallel beta-helix repeat protein
VSGDCTMRLIPLLPPQTILVLKTLMTTCAPSLICGLVLFTAAATATPEGAIAQTSATAQSSDSRSPAANSTPSTQRILFVNAQAGSDQTADGSEAAPFRTLTHALQAAQPNTIILLASGTYSADSGESFPLRMKPGVTIQGDPTVAGEGYVIQGGGLFISPTSARQNIAMLAADQAVLIGVTLSNPNPRGYGLWVESSNPIVLSNTFTGSSHDGISTVGNSAPLIQGNLFVANGANGITIFGRSHPQVQENIFERTGFGINIAENASPLLVGNRISQNRIGVVVQENARPVLRGNLIEGSREDGIAAIDRAQPDLGTATEPGNNTFLNNARYDINAAAAKQIIVAAGNQLVGDRTSGRIDLTGTVAAGSGSSSTVMVASVANQLPLRDNAELINQLPPSSQPSQPGAPDLFSSASVPSSRNAITIPVPTPEVPTLSASRPASRSTAPSRSPSRPAQTRSSPGQAIDIPVPPPESVARSVVSPPSAGLDTNNSNRLSPPNQPATPTLQADLLPVPSSEVPVGNIGDLPTVTVPMNSVQRSADNAVFTNSSAALRYRVLVEANSDRSQELVRSIVPNAFLVRERGRSMMQVGAFSSRDNAESAIQMLNQNGLRGLIEKID